MARVLRDGDYDTQRIADEQGLLFDGHKGSPYTIKELVDTKQYGDAWDEDKWGKLFDHTARFKPRGSGKKRPVLAISSVYYANDDTLKEVANECAAALGLSVRVGDDRDQIYQSNGKTTTLLFWRADLHTLR